MPMYVAGEWRGAEREEEVRNPYDGEVVDTVPVATAADAELALAAAEDGARAMRALSAWERSEILGRAADAIDGSLPELARTISLEVGKPLLEATNEAKRIPDLLRVSASEGARLHGETVPVDAAPGGAGKLAFTLRQPCGIVVAITPFNYPALLVMHKVGPALATGNAVVLKPARQTPLTALLLTRALLEAGLPENALQCLTGPGAELGNALCSDPRVRKISFTGSTAVGEQIARVAGVKRLSLELGSNCPLIVLPDVDLEQVAAATLTGGYVNAGQVCISVQRVLVAREVYGDFVDALTPLVGGLRTGHPLDEATGLGPVISEAEAERVERTIRDAVEGGATLVAGGGREGAVVEPTIVGDVDPRMEISRAELFGPAVALTPVAGIDEAIALANDSEYGLGAGLFTADLGSALRFAREVDSGSIQINSSPLWRADLMPYGGLKGSGIGKEGPRYAVEEMTDLKTIVFHDADS
ncbi:MAG: aldehyde dehydrogenase family protein [Gaiellaceae bacterium MAG52_C11]|nr:aldehyde dehydrogenase family protein [Candidatus Gaiellasilicea maunaloa]